MTDHRADGARARPAEVTMALLTVAALPMAACGSEADRGAGEVPSNAAQMEIAEAVPSRAFY